MTAPRVAIALGALGAGLLAFAYWGTSTQAGRRAYDEMAGMIPYGAGLLGALLLAAAAVLVVVRRLRG